MREIKFRAWDLELKTMWSNAQNAYDTIHHHSRDNSKGLEESLQGNCFQEVLEDPNYIIMQFTGLKDKNGKEIYEGDILQFDQTSVKVFRRVVTFHEGCFGYRDLTGAWCSPIKGIEWEVIGNIHENGDLLK